MTVTLPRQDGDRNERQLYALMEFLAQPKTYNQIAEQFGVHKQTAWRLVKQLRDLGRVVETPFRHDREATFIAIGETTDEGVVNIVTPAGSRPIGWWASLITEENMQPGKGLDAIRDLSGALAHLWRYRVYVGDPEHEHLAGSMSVLETKSKLRFTLEFLRRLAVATEQCLLAPIWDEDSDVIAAYGPVVSAQMVELGEAFENRHGS